MAIYIHIQSYSITCAVNTKALFSKTYMIHLFFTKVGVMVHLFMLVSVLLDHTRLSNLRDLHCVLNIRLENLCVDKVETGGRSGSDQGADTGNA